MVEVRGPAIFPRRRRLPSSSWCGSCPRDAVARSRSLSQPGAGAEASRIVAATPSATPPTPHAVDQPRPTALSSEIAPGPVSATEAPTAASTTVYSHPPLITQGPRPAATTPRSSMTPTTDAPASGVRKPSASMTPPPASLSPAMIAKTTPGRYPSISKKAPVPRLPCPPNQPNSFCVPWPTSATPTTTRRISNPASIVVTPSSSCAGTTRTGAVDVWTMSAAPDPKTRCASRSRRRW